MINNTNEGHADRAAVRHHNVLVEERVTRLGSGGDALMGSFIDPSGGQENLMVRCRNGAFKRD